MGDWEQRKLGELLTEVKRPIKMKDDESYELVTVKRRNEGIVSRGIFKGKDVLVNSQFQIKTGDYLISKRQVVHGANGIVPNHLNNAIVSNEYLVSIGNKNITTDFLSIISRLPSMYRKFFLSSYGIDIEKLVFNVEDWKKRTIQVPGISEQNQITIFFKQLDSTIALHQRQQDNYKQLKKYMLQKIFNQEFRFKDKNGNDYPDWEEIALKELGETFTGLSGKTKENFGKGKGKFVTYMNVFSNSTANLAMTENVEIKDGEKQNEVRYGDIFFTTSSETPDEVGMSSVWLSHESNVYLNSFCFGYRLNSESEGKVTHQFLGVQLRADRIRKQIVFLAQGSTRFNISKAKLTEIPVYLPAIQEQQKIADFLSMLDLRIEQLSQKVELLKEQKKGLIQQMFV